MLPIESGQEIALPAQGSWPAARHVFDEKAIWAVNAAMAAERPLLVRGEPGAGKSQLARAVAQLLDRLFVSDVVHARSECQDLQYWYDAVGRLGEAQLLGACGQADDAEQRLAPQKFLAPGPLWWVFDWQSAKGQFDLAGGRGREPLAPEEWQPAQGAVLLIDEIDKADADLPNGLLETLGNSAFSVPHRRQPVTLSPEAPPPLVVISTNEERELPAAFIRRCMVLHLALPEEEGELIDWLMERGRVNFGKKCSEAVRRQAAEQLSADRQAAEKLGLSPPGQAEYLDILRALSRMAADEDGQLEKLALIKDFALKKHSGE